MKDGAQRARPLSLNRKTFGQIMEKAVPLDRVGDERIEELLSQLRDERDRRAQKKAAQEQQPRH